MYDEMVNPASAVFVIFMVVAFLVWLCLPPLVWDFTEDDDVWYIDDYKLNRNECIEVFRSNNLCFRVQEEDLIRDHTNDADNEEENNEQLTSTSTTPATGQNIQADCLDHNVGDHADIDIETGGKSVMCINIVEAIIDEGKNPNDDIIETSGVNVDHDRCDIDSDDGGDDNATIDSDNNGVVLRIPNRAESLDHDCDDIDNNDGEDDDATIDSDSVVLRIPSRAMPLTTRLNNRDTVPIVCAICLEKFKVNDELAFSSNHKCSHVFHLDCITEYIGKTKGAEKPCPCCRQWFLNVPMFICDETDDGGEMPMFICTEDEDDGGDKIKRKEEKSSTANELFLAL